MNDPFNEILDFLFLGSAKSLEYKEFDMIINCTKDIDFPYDNQSLCIRIPIIDYDDKQESNLLLSIINELKILEQIHLYIKNKKSVLIHCLMGMQRSCAVAACYLIKFNKMTPTQAIEYIRLKRPIAFFGKINFLHAIETFYEDNKNY